MKKLSRIFLVMIALLLSPGLSHLGSAQQPVTETRPDLVLRRTIGYSDDHRILSIPFEVPPGTLRISMKFTYTEQAQGTALDFGLMGPTGFRGWSGGDKDEMTLASSDATPSYLPGAIEAGKWTLLIGVPNIRPSVVSQLAVEVFFDRTIHAEINDPQVAYVARQGTAWYRGDLHMHTAHSDGSCKSESGKSVPCPLFKTLEAAVAHGLDFISITDHNTQSHYDDERELQPYFDKILLMPGREITTYYGHANLWGTTEFLDFRLGTRAVPDTNAILRQVGKLGATVSINHPALPSGEDCMGCGWTPDSAVDYSLIQAIEVVNGRDADGSKSGVLFWESLLNRGYHLAAVGGSDNHDADLTGQRSIGYPTTVVKASELSTAAILEGLRAGHVFVDTEGTKNRLLDYSVMSGSQQFGMGDTVRIPPAATMHLSIHVTHAEGAHLQLISDGVVVPIEQNAAIRSDDQSTALELNGNSNRKWIRLEVITPAGHRLLIGNPIYISH